MLKPYICVACEKVILEQPLPGSPESATGVASLISLFNRIVAVSGGDQQAIPPNAVVPKEWAVFSSWDAEPGDEKKKYMVCTQIYYPDESPFGETAKLPLTVELNKRSQNIVRVLGFPVGQEGAYTVKTWLEENEQRVFGPIEFKIALEIKKQSNSNEVNM